jgi:hypothetical protein
MKTVSLSNCCDEKSLTPIVQTRHVTPELALTHVNAFTQPLPKDGNYKNAVMYKCAMQRRGGRVNLEVKVGSVTSTSPVLQGLQSVGSMIIPGDTAPLRSPLRSGLARAITPGGGRGINPFAYGKPNRGYRCPEGYQYGGRFTDSRFSTCGKQLFDLPGIIGAAIGTAIRRSAAGVANFEPSGRRVGALSVSGDIIQSRAPQIPKVSALNKRDRNANIASIVAAMAGVAEPYRRMVRRDGFVLEPVVSNAVLRTIPDNRDMEGATFVQTALDRAVIGKDELGLLSNTGVQKLVYVLPGGSTLNIEKARPLTVGERRKLGKTVNVAINAENNSDPASRLRFVAEQMGDAIAYSESFNDIKDPNAIITVTLPGTKRKTQLKRWVYESFYKRKPDVPTPSETEITEGDSVGPSEKIDNLSGAVRHLNAGGSLENISSSLRVEALRRSRLYKSGKLKEGVILHERADGQTVFEIRPKRDFEHIGASVASEVQRSLGLSAPKVRLSGSGNRRTYLIGEAQDTPIAGSQNRASGLENVAVEDLVGLAVADWLLDTHGRTPANISPINISGAMRAVASINPMSGGISARGNNRQRFDIDMNDFFGQELREMYRRNFEKLKLEQRRKALNMIATYIERAQNIDFPELRKRLSLDGEMSEAEKRHLSIIETLFNRRLETLRTSRAAFMSALGLRQ